MTQNNQGHMLPGGDLKIKHAAWRKAGWHWKLRNVLRLSFLRGWFAARVLFPLVRPFGLLTSYGMLSAVKITLREEDRHYFDFMMRQALAIEDEAESRKAIEAAQQWAWQNGTKTDYGVLGYRVVTTAFVNFVTDQLQTETSVFGDFKYHDSGVGTTAENASDTAIETTDGESRATGTQTESAANAYRSVGTISYTSTKAITEHGLFNDSSAGTLMDRTVFSAVNVVNGESIQFTYTLTLSSGG